MRVLTVSQINFFLKSLIEGDGRLTDVYVAGEISNFTDHYRSGHLYFSLKDEKSVLKAVMFASAARRLRFRPGDGMRVIVRGRVSVYEPSGQYQFYVEEMQPDGLGALSLAFEQMKAKLSKEGLFSEEFKKPIPRFPARIGIITSPTGAAVRDMLNILGRRWPAAELIFCPVLVQGEGAPAQLTAAVEEMNRKRCADVILIGRGGGSAEDLAAFNDEALARAIFASEIPVISAVGHETDFTICDFVADLRAPTPSAAAELCVPDQGDVRQKIFILQQNIQKNIQNRCNLCYNRFNQLATAQLLQRQHQQLDRRGQALAIAQAAVRQAAQRHVQDARRSLQSAAAVAESLSPYAVLARGYALPEQNGTPCAVETLRPGEAVTLRGARAAAECRVEAVHTLEQKTGE